MITLDKTLDAAMELPPEQQEMLIEILQKRRIEERRKEIAENAREAKQDLDAGKISVKPVEQIIEELNESINQV